MCSRNLKLLTLQEHDGREYSLLVSEDEYNRATKDMLFAQDMLNQYKKTDENSPDPDTMVELPAEEGTSSSSSVAASEASTAEPFWSHAETLLLITLYSSHKDDFSHARKRKHVWEIIVEEMAAHNYFRTPDKRERKWTNLIRVYRAIKDNKGPKKTGRGAQHYKYYERIDEIIGDKPSNSASSTAVINAGINQEVVPANEDDDANDYTTTDNDLTVTENTAEEGTSVTPKRRRLNQSLHLAKQKLLQKEKRHREILEIEKKKIELEERKLNILEKYLDILQKSNQQAP